MFAVPLLIRQFTCKTLLQSSGTTEWWHLAELHELNVFLGRWLVLQRLKLRWHVPLGASSSRLVALPPAAAGTHFLGPQL